MKENKNKTKLALLAVKEGYVSIFFVTLKYFSKFYHWCISPLVKDGEKIQRQNSIPESLRLAYTRDWDYTTLSEIRAEAGRKGGEAKKSKNKNN